MQIRRIIYHELNYFISTNSVLEASRTFFSRKIMYSIKNCYVSFEKESCFRGGTDFDFQTVLIA